jgi:hypothetical protein
MIDIRVDAKDELEACGERDRRSRRKYLV